MKKVIVILVSVIVVVITGIFLGMRLIEKNDNNKSLEKNNSVKLKKENLLITTTEIASQEEKTTPNTLLVYKIYYTKCKHFIRRYENIDASKVNLTEDEFKEKYKKWRIDSFSSKEIELSKEEEKFCDEHYKLRLENDEIIVYKINENGEEKEYKKTNITKEYLTDEDILKLSNGIIVYGKENLNDAIEDYK